MVSNVVKDGQECLYMHFIVVRHEEFDSYRCNWGSTHGIIELPDQIPDCDEDINSGGRGYAKLFIQKFALCLGQPYIFMTEDTISCVKQVNPNTSLNGSNKMEHPRRSLEVKAVPLFKVLKHMETHGLHPQGMFEQCPGQKEGVRICPCLMCLSEDCQ